VDVLVAAGLVFTTEVVEVERWTELDDWDEVLPDVEDLEDELESVELELELEEIDVDRELEVVVVVAVDEVLVVLVVLLELVVVGA